MADSKPTPIHSIQHTKFSGQGCLLLRDISLCSSGNIAVSGYHYDGRTFVCVYSTVDNSDSRDKPTLLYEKEFEKYSYSWHHRYISFIKPNSTEIVTCVANNVTVLDYNRDVVLRSRKVNGNTTCLSVSESQIFIGLEDSDIVNIYDNDLNRIKSIKLKEMREDWPRDISSVADRLYVCTELYRRAIVYSQTSGSILSEYTTVQDSSSAWSITVNVHLCVTAVLWNLRQVAVYSFTNNNCLVVFDVESVNIIRISDQGRIVTGNEGTGEVKIYDLAQLFTYNNLKSTLSSLFSKHDLEELVKYFKICNDSLGDDSDGRRDDKKQAARLLTLLEEKQFFQDGDFHHLKEAFSQLGKCHTSMVMSHVDFYQQYVADKNTTNYMQTSEDNGRGCNLQVDGFSGDWSACDMSLGSSYMVVAGYCNTAKKTSLDFICKDGSGSWSSWVKTREFDRGGSDSERVVSFIDEHRIVTCCGNVVEIIHCDTNETEVKHTLQSSCFATCITVRNQDVYIGFKEPANILVLNRDLLEKRTITLKEIKTMWPIDLAAIPGKLLVCLKNTVSSKVILFKKKNGQKLVEYRNVEDENRTPQSVAVNEESDLVGILWAIDPEEYDREPYGQISLHSLTHVYCLSVVSVAFTVHGYDCSCDDGCSSGKRIQLLSGQLAVMDDLGGVKLYNMKEVLSEENLSYALSKALSCRDDKGFQAALENDEDISDSDGSSSGSELDNESNEEGRNLQKMSKLYKILAILTDKKHVDSECITNLKEKFSQFDGSSYDDSARELHADRNEVQFYRFHWYNDDDDEYNKDVDICFGSNNEVAVSHFSKLTGERYIYINNMDRDKKIQPSVSFYRKFDDGNSKLYVSFLDGCRAVTCCGGLIEVTDFDAYGKITKSHRLSSPATCMATKDGDVFIGFKSPEIVVFDSDLVEKRTTITVRVKNGEWPNDLTVISGKVFVCTDGTSQRALSFNVEHGQQVTEYSYEGNGMCVEDYPVSLAAVSLAVCENQDLIGISWYEQDNYWNYEKGITSITLHSLARGFCVSVLDDNPARIIRFSPNNYINTVSKRGKIERYLVGQMITLDSWKAGFAHSVSPCVFDLIRGFYQLSVAQIDDKIDAKYLEYSHLRNVERLKIIMEILVKKSYITSTNVTSLKKAFGGLGEIYVDRFYQPVEAYIKFTGKTCVAAVSVPPCAPSNKVAESLLQLRYSTQRQNNTSINTVFQQSNPIQCYPGQPSSQEQVTSTPGPSRAPITEALANSADKRVLCEGNSSTGAYGSHAKRAKTGEKESGSNILMDLPDHGIGENLNPSLNQWMAQMSEIPSFLQLMEGDPSTNHSTFNMARPVTSIMRSTIPLGTTQVETIASPMIAQPTVCHQSSINTSGPQMSVLQVSSLGTQHTSQIMSTPCPVRGEVQTSIQSLGQSKAQQVYTAVTSQQHQTMRQTRQSIIPQALPLTGCLMPPVFRQPKLPSQLQSTGHFITPQTEEFVVQNVAAPEHQQNGRSQGQLISQNLRQNAGRQEIQHASQSFPPAMVQPVSFNTGQNAEDIGNTTMPQNPCQVGPMRNKHMEQRTAQQNSHQTIQLGQSNNLSHETQVTGSSVEQQQSTTEPRTTCNINQTHRTECESAAMMSQGRSEEIKTAIECSFQKVVTPLLKDLSNKLGHLLGSSNTPNSWQDIPGTSSQSDNNVSNSAAHARNLPDSEPDQEVMSAWESLSEYDRMSLQAFRGMTDDRAELVRRLVEMVFTEEERHNRNCFGKSGKQKLDANKLRKIRHITFYLCPIITKTTDLDKLSLEDVEWKRLCEVIDKSNRHFREKLKRQENRR